jgi:hypothetical protein
MRSSASGACALRTHIFNGVIWPDFTRLPSAGHPMLELVPFGIGEVLDVNGKRIEVLTAVHTVPAVGFAVDGGTDEASASRAAGGSTPATPGRTRCCGSGCAAWGRRTGFMRWWRVR